MAILRATASASSLETAPETPISSRTVAPSPSATIWRASARTSLDERLGELRVARGGAGDAARAVGEQHDGVVGRAVAVDGDPVEGRVHRRAQQRIGVARLERVVRSEDREHRRETGMDHPGALRHPCDDEAVARDARLLRTAIGGEDRPGGVVTAAGGEARRRLPHSCQHALERERHPDDAGRKDEDLVLVERERSGRRGGRPLGVRDPGGTGRGVRDASVHDHRLRLGGREMALRDQDRSREDSIRRPYRGAHGRRGGADDGEVEAGAPDPRPNARGDEPGRRGHAHQTSTPDSRRPAVSSSPKRTLTFWIA